MPLCQGGQSGDYDDGDEATVDLTEVTHSHFNSYDESLSNEEHERRIAEDLVDFLKALFADQVLLFRTQNRGMGGWCRLDRSNECPRPEIRCEYFLWSRPFQFGQDGLPVNPFSQTKEPMSDC